MRTALTLLGIVLLATIGFSATIYVPDSYSTIQGAINASANGDTIVVRAGTYMENIDFLGKNIVVRSESGPQSTTIDGSQSGSVVTFQSGESAGAILSGLTITNGKATAGGGCYCYNASPTIMDNFIRNNTVDTLGGGIGCYLSSPRISGNTIRANAAEDQSSYGGGIGCHTNCSPTIENNIIAQNRAEYGGGGIECKESPDTLISGNLIIANEATSFGGGIQWRSGLTGVITGNVISQNIANSSAGIRCEINSSPTISGNRITDNQAASCGGIFCGGPNSSPVLSGNIVSGNKAQLEGGGICCSGSTLTPLIVNNLIVGNEARLGGAGIQCTLCSMEVINCIVWDNVTGGPPEEILVGTLYSSATLAISHSDVKGGKSACNVHSTSTLIWGQGMIDADPLFADSATNDFHLTWPSPCRSTGDNSAVTEVYDFEGDPRIAGGTVDMGADEFYYHLYSIGDVLPGSPIDIKVVGAPGSPALLALGTGIQDPPQSTPHGDLWLTMPLAKSWQLGAIPYTGILTMSATVPSGWPFGSLHPFQALVGPWGGVATRLTNLHVLVVE